MRVIIRKGSSKGIVYMCVIILLIIPLAGCWDSNEPERMIYAQGLGLDYKKGKYIAYIQLINLSLLAKQTGGGGGNVINSEIGHAEGNSAEDAIFNLYKTSQRRIHWGHLTYVFLTKSALQHNGLQTVTDSIDRYFETHYHIWMYNTEKHLLSLMNTIPPLNMSTYLSRLSDPDAAFGQYSFIQSMDMREVIISHYEPPHEIIIPFVENSSKEWKSSDGKSRNIAVIKGISVLENNTFKGTLLNQEVNGMRWMEKKFKRTGLSFLTKGNANIGIIITKRKVKVIPTINDHKVQFDIQIGSRGVIDKLEKNAPTSEIESKVKTIIKKEILETYRKGVEIDSDVYRLSNVLYRKNFPEWKKIQKKGKIPLTKDSIRNITIDFMIIDGGKQRKIPTLNG